MSGAIILPHRVMSFVAPWHCFLQLDRPAGTRIIPTEGSALSGQKNAAVRAALEDASCEWILIADDDQLYPPDALTRLLAHNVPIVSGLVTLRKPPFDPVVATETETGFARIPPAVVKTWGEGLMEVPATTGAFTLYRREVFAHVEPPWFTPSPSGTNEDLRFCARARAAGYRSYVDCSLRIGHLVLMAVQFGDGEPVFSEPA